MHDAFFVRRLQCVADLAGSVECLREFQPSADSLRERLAFDELQDQGLGGTVRLQAVNGCDVWMIQRGEDARLALETG